MLRKASGGFSTRYVAMSVILRAACYARGGDRALAK